MIHSLSNLFKISVWFSEKVCLAGDLKNRLIARLFDYFFKKHDEQN